MIDLDQRLRLALEQIAEVKRILFATEHALNHKRPATILVTSAVQGEGKTLFASALASAAAKSEGRRVVALDFNWFKPALHRGFGLDLDHSIEEILDAELGEVVRPSGQEGLDVLVAPHDHDHPQAPSRQIPRGVSRLIVHARHDYDLAVIDSASIYPTNRMMIDPVMLAGLVDGVILVVQASVTPRQQVRGAQKLIETAGGTLLGVVSNRWQGSTTHDA
ncbi:MAG: tyrosine-protein kinase family protein [Sphingobacteriia bacterium]|nr:tyrosine-protein kinase family protein [Sphingobacteriia bacterium]